MTVGQRIAQKRKELGLSQEGLGEQLGVSRQAIYKWESDASLPEIDKLITLSKIFSVPVGRLLGVEEEPAPPEASPGELTEQQLAMVQEIVDRYLAAQPQPAPPKRRRLVKFCAMLALAALVVCLFNLFSKLDRVSQNYDNLRWSVDNVSSNVNRQIGSITNRVEDILKSQNALTAEWSAQAASTDLLANTVTFDVRVVPKTYVEGMTAVFQARSGEETVELPVEPGADHAFAGQITCPLTDDISLTVVFVTGDKRETQWLEDYEGLYSGTFPPLQLHDVFWWPLKGGSTLLPSDSPGRAPVEVWNDSEDNRFLSWNPKPPAALQAGLFRDQTLVLWYEGRVRSVNWDGAPGEDYAWYLTQEVELEPGHTYQQAALYTDEYGRQMIYSGVPIEYSEREQCWEPVSNYMGNSYPADWTF